MKTIVIMQPYFFPYIGYFQLATQADLFVFLNDVDYIKRSWINRNRILVNGRPSYISVPLKKASQNRKIHETYLSDHRDYSNDILKTLLHAYGKAPYFYKIKPLCEEVFAQDLHTIDQLAQQSIIKCFDYLDLPFTYVQSKGRYFNESLKGEDRIIDIVLREHGTDYLNLPGGKNLYFAENFTRKKIRLNFITPVLNEYKHGFDSFVPGLSIIDVLMWNSKEHVREWLKL
jgi:hypothetical protein